MNFYRQKSQTIEAVQFDPKQHPWPDGVALDNERQAYVKTDEGKAYVHSGDWIVRGASGTLHVCKDAIFTATYEPVDAILDAPTYDKIYQTVMARIEVDLKKQVGGNV